MNSNLIVYNSLKLEPKLRCIITPRGCDEVRQNKPLQHKLLLAVPHTCKYWLPWKWNIKIIKWLFSLWITEHNYEENIAQEINKQTKIKAIKKIPNNLIK